MLARRKAIGAVATFPRLAAQSSRVPIWAEDGHSRCRFRISAIRVAHSSATLALEQVQYHLDVSKLHFGPPPLAEAPTIDHLDHLGLGRDK